MSEIVTIIKTTKKPWPVGIMESGEIPLADAIAAIRRYADHLRAEAAKIDSTADHEFSVRVVRGPVVKRPVKVLQEGGAS
jgi:hypothetical protein